MKKKTCSWLNSKLRGGIQILDDGIWPCCGPSKPFYNEKNLDYLKITAEELMEKRKHIKKARNNKPEKIIIEIINKFKNTMDVEKICKNFTLI